MPYRGPEYYQSGEYTYKCNVTGDFRCFQGYEEIYCNNIPSLMDEPVKRVHIF